MPTPILNYRAQLRQPRTHLETLRILKRRAMLETLKDALVVFLLILMLMVLGASLAAIPSACP